MDQRLGMSDNLTRSLRVSRQLLGRGSNIHNAMNFSPTVSIGSKKKGEYSHTKLNKKIDYVTICQRYVATFVQNFFGICKEMGKKRE